MYKVLLIAPFQKKRLIQLALAILALLVSESLCSQTIIKFRKRAQVKYNASTKVLLSRGFRFRHPEQKVFSTKAYKLSIYARSFAQGNLIYLEIKPKKREEAFHKTPRISFDKRKVPVSATSWGYRGFVGISPNEKLGQHKVHVKVHVASISDAPYIHAQSHNLWIRNTNFPVSREKIRIMGSQKSAGRRLSRKQRLNIRRFALQKRRALRHYTDKILIKKTLSHPRGKHFITSDFWSTRYIARFRRKNNRIIQIRPKKRVHRGLDLRARTGAPIYALADGKVIISEKMHYEGNFILIDHGQSIFSGYMHLNKRYVHRGRYIRAGQQLGQAGATGAVSAAHLHLLLYVRNVPVNPLSLLALPIRD